MAADLVLNVYTFIKSIVLPPGIIILALLAGVLFWRRPMLGRMLVLSAAIVMLLLSFPFVSDRLIQVMEYHPPLETADLRTTTADAIVVLSAGRKTRAAEFGTDTIGPLTLQRVRYAAWLHRQTGLPIYVSGGPANANGRLSLATLMRDVLENEFRVPVAGMEDSSRDTAENAQFTSVLMQKEGRQHILLVSHAFHLPRALWAFRKTGLQVTPAPTAFGHHREKAISPILFVISADAFRISQYAIHEYLGLIWYKLRNWATAS